MLRLPHPSTEAGAVRFGHQAGQCTVAEGEDTDAPRTAHKDVGLAIAVEVARGVNAVLGRVPVPCAEARAVGFGHQTGKLASSITETQRLAKFYTNQNAGKGQ